MDDQLDHLFFSGPAGTSHQHIQIDCGYGLDPAALLRRR